MTFNSIYNRCLDLSLRTRSGATSPVNYTTLFKALVNETQSIILPLFPFPFLEKTTNLTSVASQQSYELPINCKNNQIIDFNFQVSATEIYRPKPVQSSKFWEYLQSLGTSDSDVIQYYYIYDEKIFLYPKPATGSKTMQVRHRITHRNMTQDDYTTGTIITTTNGGTGVIGTATPNWAGGLSPEATLHIRITKTASDSAKSGDGRWYEIASITDDTNIILVKPYQGTSIVSGTAAYTIGELPLIPEPFPNLLIWRSLAIYFMQNEEDMVRADRYWMMYDGGYEAGRSPVIGGGLKRILEAYSGTQEGVYIEPLQEKELTIQDLSIKDRDYSGENW